MITERPGRQQHNGRGRARRIGRARDGDPAVGLLQRGGVVHAVACHADDVAVLLQHVDDMKLMFGEHLSEAVRILDGLGHRRGFLGLGVAEGVRVEDVRAHSQRLGHLAGDRQSVARHHLDLHAHLSRRRDGGLGVFPRRIEQRQDAEKPPFAVAIGARDAERTKAARGEVVDSLVHGGLHRGRVRRQRQDDLRRALGHLECLSIRALDRGLGPLVHGIEWRENA